MIHQTKKVAGLTVIILTIILAMNTVNAMGVTTTITVGQSPNGIAYDSGKGEIFVSSMGENCVKVISDTNNTVVKTIPVGSQPMGLAYDSGRGEIFVCSGDSKVYVISDTNNTVVANISVGTYPFYATYIPTRGEIYVSNMGITGEAGSISVISDTNNTVVKTIGLKGYKPRMVCYDAGKGQIFAPCTAYDDKGPIFVIAEGNYTIVNTIYLAPGALIYEPMAACYDAGKGEIFVTNSDNSVSIISDTNYTVFKTLHVGVSPHGMAYDPSKGWIFLAAGQMIISTTEYYDTVQVISDSNNTLFSSVAVGQQPKMLVYDDAKGEIFVANSYVNTVSVISDSASVPNQHGTNNNGNPATNPPTGSVNKKGTPGFELPIIICAAALVVFLKRKRQ